MIESRRKIIWVEVLGLFSVLYWGLKSIFDDIEVRFDEHRTSGLASQAGYFFNQILGRSVFVQGRLFLNQVDSTGSALEYRRLELLSKILDSYCQQQGDQVPKNFQYMMRSYLASYLKLENRVGFIVMVEYQALKMKDFDHEILLTGGPGVSIIIDFLKLNFARVRQSFSPKAYVLQWGFVLLLTGRLLINHAFLMLYRVPKKEGNEVLIEYPPPYSYWQEFLNHLSGSRNNRGYRMTLYWDRRDTPLTRKIQETMKRDRFDTVNLKGYCNMSLSCKEMWAAYVFALKETGPRRSALLFLFHYHFKVLFYTSLRLYRERQVKILIQHQEVRWTQEVQAQAIKAAGGIMIGLHWSNYQHFNYPTHLTPQHVFFVWGKAHEDFLKNKGNTCEYILPCGVWVGDSSKSVPVKIDFPENVDFTIGVFDNGGKYSIYTSSESLGIFYRGVVELLEEYANWGAVIKSKGYRLEDFPPFPDAEQLGDRMRKLIGQRRVVWLDFDEYSPVAVARVVDLSLCLGVNSAGIVCGLYGFPAIHWDNVGWKRYPSYNEMSGGVIFPSLEAMKKAAVLFYKGDRSIGDFSTWAQYHNFFCDQNGLMRMAEFMDMFMNSLDQAQTRDGALADAVSAYYKKNRINDECLKS